MLLENTNCQLVLVDYQVKLLPTIFEHPFILNNAQILSRAASLFAVPQILSEQVPEKLGETQEALGKICLDNGGKLLVKNCFSACGAHLLDMLLPAPPKGNAKSLPKHLQQRQPERTTIVIAGIEAHICVLQTALDLLEAEMDVWIVTDATSSRTERNRDAAFDRLASNGAELVTTEMVLFEWMRSTDNQHFKQVIQWIK